MHISIADFNTLPQVTDKSTRQIDRSIRNDIVELNITINQLNLTDKLEFILIYSSIYRIRYQQQNMILLKIIWNTIKTHHNPNHKMHLSKFENS